MRALHVFLDLLDGRKLVFGLGEFKGVFELALPVAIVRILEAFGHAALRVELQQLVGHVAHLGFYARFGALPSDASQPVEPGRRAFASAAIFLDQIQARKRHIELGVARVFEQHEIALVVALRDLARSHESADAVRFVHHVIAGLQIGHVGSECGKLRFGRAGFGD